MKNHKNVKITVTRGKDYRLTTSRASNKYGARKVYTVNGTRFASRELAQHFADGAQDKPPVLVFDSVHEYDVYKQLKQRERAGEISYLSRQVVFELLPNQYEIQKTARGTKRKLIERRVIYTADFVYFDHTGARVVADAKSTATRTRDYIIRRKLMLYIHGIKIKEL